MDAILNAAVESLIQIVALVVISALGLFGTWLLNKIKQNKNLQNIGLATEQVLKASQETVEALQQTLVNTWKESQGGKLTEEQIAELKQKVIEQTMASLAQPTIDLLKAAKVDVATMISSFSESYINKLKSAS